MSLFGPTAFGGLYEQNGGILGGFGGMQQAQAQPQPFGISPDMLIALGAGIAGGKDWGSGIGAGLQGALGARQFHQKLAGGGLGPASVQEYQFAIRNGFKGSFQEWIENKTRGDQRFGLQPVYAQDAQGNLRAFQLDSSGGMKPIEFGDGLKPAPGVNNLNLGTSIQPVSNKTGLPVAPPVPVDVAGEASQKAGGAVQGTTAAQAQVDWPTIRDKGDKSLQIIDSLIDHPGRETATGASATFDPRNYFPGTNAKNFRIQAKQIEGRAFLEAFESLRGGGAITQIEGEKGTQAIARLDRAQSDDEYKNALFDLREVVEAGMNRARARAGLPPVPLKQRGQVSTPAPNAQQNPAAKSQDQMPKGPQGVVPAEFQSKSVAEQLGNAPEGSTYVDKATGIEYIKKNRRWVPNK